MTTETKTILEPTDDRVLVRPIEESDVTKGGIVIPTQAKDKPTQGEIVAKGPGKRNEAGERIEIPFAEGDVVVYSKYAGTAVKLNGEDHLILRENDVIAIVRS